MASIQTASAIEPKLKRFQELLRNIFQFDSADLDFGIYRILNYKRNQIETFISEQLPEIVNEAFGQYAVAERAILEQELAQLKERIETSGGELGQAPFDEGGRLKETFYDGKLGKRYLHVLEKVQCVDVAEELKSRTYNDLYAFFSRYYEDGDFISKRRYGRSETYAIPYNGEEVVLYWANKDQYYVKSSENFSRYHFKTGDYAVAFELRNASVEQDDNKGKKRYFVLAEEDAICWDEKAKLLTLFFEYRWLTSEEQDRYGRTERQRPQDKLNERAVLEVLSCIPDMTLKGHLAKMKDDGHTLLLKQLTRFTRENTRDFFIHKDLRGFLMRELDFFIKNKVLLLDELFSGVEQNLNRHIHRARVVRDVAEKIIDVLAQVEDFQKRLWEKKKFVVRTDYCATVDCVPEELWDEVLHNEPQTDEWRRLYSLEELLKKQGLLNTGLNKDFLSAHPTLVVDTRYFPEDFKWRFLASLDDLDDVLDGLLVKSENWQALNLLAEKYRDSIKCIYIDPPYNSPSTEIIYKNNYKHSSWNSLMSDRLLISKDYLMDEGLIVVAIDDHEVSNLRAIMRSIYQGAMEVAVVRSNPAGRSTPRGFSLQHEYTVFSRHHSSDAEAGRLEHSEKQIRRYDKVDEIGPFEWVNFRKHGGLKRESSRMFYPIFLDEINHKWRVPHMTWSDDRDEWVIREEPSGGERVLLPIDDHGQLRRWKWGVERLLSSRHEVSIGTDRHGNLGLYIKSRLPSDGRTPPTWWDKKEYSATDWGTKALKDLFGAFGLFDYPKAVDLVKDCLLVGSVEKTDRVLDFFAGSGTTAHAVINLNREDGGQRRFILVEMADYFDTVLLPRIKKVIFAPEWADGKPLRLASKEETERSPQLIKYLRLESYEDTLNNLELAHKQEGQLALEMFGSDYVLNYMLDFETKGSPSLLNLEMFKDPFAYQLKVQEGDEFVQRNVDLVETFNYLLGIKVNKVRFLEKDKCSYCAVLGEKMGRRIAIVWRPTVDMEEDKSKLMADKEFIEGTVLPALLGEGSKPDRLLVNGPCYAEGVEAIEPEFKRLMFSGVI